MDERKNSDESWRKLLMHHLLEAACLVCITELVMFFYLLVRVSPEMDTSHYFIKYMLFPSVCNLLIITAGHLMIRSSRMDSRQKNEIPLYCIAAVGFVLVHVHSRFAITAGVFVVPVLISAVYGSVKVTRRITAFCLALAGISLIIPLYDPQVYRADDRMNKLLSIFFILGTYVFAGAMLTYMDRKNKELSRSKAERHELKENLKRDAMTGLFNHVEFYRYLEELIGSGRPDIHVAVIDIDDFKKVNDTYGHEKGNHVLTGLSGILTRECGRNAHISRYGGEEFTVVFADRTTDEVYDTMEIVRKSLENLKLSDIPAVISVSIGIASFRPGMTARQLFERADEAMYCAKHSGKNQTQTL